MNRSVVVTSYQLGWIKCRFQNILGQKRWQYNVQNWEIVKWKFDSEIYRPATDTKVHLMMISCYPLKKIDINTYHNKAYKHNDNI